jgi:hypothetical protein
MKTQIQSLTLFLLSPVLALGLISCTQNNSSAPPEVPAITIAPPVVSDLKELSVEIVGAGSVLIKGVVCSSAFSPCKIQIQSGESVVLSVLPGDGQSFYRWENCASSLGTVCSQVVSQAASVRAVFVAATPTNPALNCPAGAVVYNNSCMPLVKTCVLNAKNGTQTWSPDSLAYGACTPNPDNLSCSTSSVLVGSQCLALIQSCLLPNGTGVQALNTTTNTYGTCTANSCSAGYAVSNSVCVVSSCPSGQHIENNACTTNIQSCSPLNGSGIKVWNQSSTSFSTCQLTNCNASYVISNDGLSCIAASQNNPCTSGKVWNGVSGAGSTCTTPVASSCSSGQYWNGSQCSDVNAAYTALASFDYLSGGTPSGFESISPAPKVYTFYIGKSYDIAPAMSPGSGIAVMFTTSDCASAKINIGLNGHISLLSGATFTAGETLSCTIKATNPVGLITSFPITVKFDNAVGTTRSLSVPNFALHESVDMLTKKFCPVVQTGTFTGGSYSLFNSNGTTLTLSGNIGGLNFSSTDGCITTSFAAGLFYFNETLVAKGASRVYPGFTVRWQATGQAMVESNSFDITYSREDDAQSLMRVNIVNKFIRLLTDSRRSAATGSELNTVQLPTITASFTLLHHDDTSLSASFTPVTNLQPTSSATDGTISKTLLSSPIPIQSQGTVGLPASVTTTVGTFRESIFTSKYSLSITNSPNAIYPATSMAMTYVPSDVSTTASLTGTTFKLDPGTTVVETYDPSNYSRTISKQSDPNTGELFAQIGFQFRKLGAAAYNYAITLLVSDVTHFDETLTAKRMPIAFTDAEDFIGIQAGNTTSFYSELTSANKNGSLANPILRFGNKTFFVITKNVGNTYQKILAYHDLDPSITNPDQRVKMVLTPIPGANSTCAGGGLCYPDSTSSPMMIYQSGTKLVMVRQITSNFTGSAQNVYAVFVMDPNDLTTAASNKVYVLETSKTFNAHSYFSRSEGLLFLSGAGFLHVFDIATGNLKAVTLTNTNSGEYYKFIKVGPKQFVVGNAPVNGSQYTDVKSFFLDLAGNNARYISLSNNPSGFNTCLLVGAGYDLSTGVKASFICAYASSGTKKLMAYTEVPFEGGGVDYYFVQASNIKSTASDILDNQLFVATFPSGNAVIMAAGDSQASQSSFYSITHTSVSGSAKVTMQKINMTGNIGSQWSNQPGTNSYLLSGNKLNFVIYNGDSTYSMYAYDESAKSAKAYFTSGTESAYNGFPIEDEAGNFYMQGRVIKQDGSVIRLSNVGSLFVKDFSNGKVLYSDAYTTRYYVADLTKNYEYQLEDVNSLVTQYSDVNGNNGGLLVGEGAIVNIRTDYNSSRRNYFIDLTPIQAK